MPSNLCFLGWVSSVTALVVLSGNPAKSQIIPDNTLPVNSTVTPGCTQCVIDGGTQQGVNLYHSFQQFSVPTGGEAHFNNSLQIQNILTRVTGTSTSVIDGLIRANGSANLFFLNPNGIIFGPNARLQIDGSFFATTASSFRLFDGSEFSVTAPQALPLLTVNITPGLQTGPIPQNSQIIVQGNLTTGQDLSLVSDALVLQAIQVQAGRDLTLQGQAFVNAFDSISTPLRVIAGRNLQIQSNQALPLFALDEPSSLFSAGGDVLLSADQVLGNSRFYARGNFQITDSAGNPGDLNSPIGATIFAGGNLSLGNIFSNETVRLGAGGSITVGNYAGASLKVETSGSLQAGNISIARSACVAGTPGCFGGVTPSDPDFGVLTNSPSVILRSGLSALSVPPNVPAFAGQTILNGTIPPISPGSLAVGNITLDIFSAPPSGLPSGPVILTAQGDIRTGGIRTTPFTFGDTGGIFLTSLAGSIDTTGGSLFSGARVGRAGSIVLDAAQDVRTGNVFSSRSGASISGNLTIISRSGSIDTTAGILSSFSTTTAPSGTITLLAGDRIQTGTVDSATTSNNAGLIQMRSGNGITTGNLSAAAFGSGGNGGPIDLSSQGDVVVGAITTRGLNAGSVTMTAAGSITTTEIEAVSFSGNGGAIQLIAGKDITLTNDLRSLSFSSGVMAGDGGDIRLTALQGSITSANLARLIAISSSSSTTNGGDGGNVTLQAQNQINNLGIFTQSSNGQAGTARIQGLGNLAISNTQVSTSATVVVTDQSGTSVPIQIGERGQSGNVAIAGVGNLTFDRTLIQSTTQSLNQAGNIEITSPGVVTLQNNSQIISNTNSAGTAGNILITANQSINLSDRSEISALTTSTGNAGSITLTAPTLTVVGNAQISAETAGRGRGGNITVNAPTAVNLTQVQGLSPVLSVEASGAGKAGDVLINTPVLTLSDRARITATATATSTNLEGGGSITLNASNLNLAGVVGVFAETQGQAPAGTLNLNPYQNQPDLNIALTPNSQISASTSGSGNGGDLIVSAPRSVTIAGPGRLVVETSSTGNAGNMSFTTGQLTLTDRVEVSASTSGAGKAGNVDITANSVTLDRGARITTNTASSGRAGDVTLNLGDQLTLTDRGTGLFAVTTPGSTGNGGNIRVSSRQVQVEDGAAIAVNSQGSGTGGNIFVGTNRLNLVDQGSITAETASAQGGNITLDVRDILLLRRNSLISATAGTAQAGGDGGNINIRAGFVVGVLQENSDIVANAFTGRGGNINITTNAIFGLLPQPRLTLFSDITASSQFGLQGTIAINTLNIDPSRGLVDLDATLSDPTRRIGLGCATRGRLAGEESRFIVTGRGGVSASPTDSFTAEETLVQLMAGRQAVEGRGEGNSERTVSSNVVVSPIIEAQNWMQDRDGTLYLVANTSVSADPNSAAPNPLFPILACDGTLHH